jgi:hypothetical protein
MPRSVPSATMWSAASILVCAMDLLSGHQKSLPPIELVAASPAELSVTAEGFVVSGQPTIYILTSSETFRHARQGFRLCGQSENISKLASIIVHEEWHARHGADEREAYAAQLTTLAMLGAGVGTPLYNGVRQAMVHVMRDKAFRHKLGARSTLIE